MSESNEFSKPVTVNGIPIPLLHAKEYEDPRDSKYLNALKLSKGFDELAKTAIEYSIERINTVLYTGSNVRVTRNNMPYLYECVENACRILNVDNMPDIYVREDPYINAFTTGAGNPILVFNNSILHRLTHEELMFIIGHEIGHLMNKDTQLLNLIYFVFPHNTTPPLVLQYKIRLWQQLSELVADRYGYMAIPDLGVCVSAFIKMASGLDFSKIDMKMDVFIEENLKHLEYFKTGQGLSHGTHPVNPVRVQSLNLFATCRTDEELNEKMDEVIQILLKLRNTELDFYTGAFIASAGLLVASADDEITDKEVEHILSNLSSFYMFPRKFLDDMCKENVEEVFIEAVQKIMEINPGMRDGLFQYMIGLVLADRMFNEKEVEFLFMIGENIFGYTKKEIADNLASAIQANFVPSFESLC